MWNLLCKLSSDIEWEYSITKVQPVCYPLQVMSLDIERTPTTTSYPVTLKLFNHGFSGDPESSHHLNVGRGEWENGSTIWGRYTRWGTGCTKALYMKLTPTTYRKLSSMDPIFDSCSFHNRYKYLLIYCIVFFSVKNTKSGIKCKLDENLSVWLIFMQNHWKTIGPKVVSKTELASL